MVADAWLWCLGTVRKAVREFLLLVGLPRVSCCSRDSAIVSRCLAVVLGTARKAVREFLAAHGPTMGRLLAPCGTYIADWTSFWPSHSCAR